MGTALQLTLPVPENSLPADLRDWIDPHALVRAVLAAVNLECPPAASTPFHEEDSMPAHTVLSLLTYCYACGMYSSRDIELCSAQDTTVRHLCAGRRPEAQQLRRFRRHHRWRVRNCLAEVLQHTRRIHPGGEGFHFESVNGDRASTLEDHQNHGSDLIEEAEARIDRAVQRDSWDLDA